MYICFGLRAHNFVAYEIWLLSSDRTDSDIDILVGRNHFFIISEIYFDTWLSDHLYSFDFMSWPLESGGNIRLHTDHLNICLSFRLQGIDVNNISFAIFCSEVILDCLTGCNVLDFTDFGDYHLFAYFLFKFADNFFHFWLVVITGRNYMHFGCFWTSYFDLL